ncbi:hypothetical protein MBLNU457_g0216t1 [Dothideomycetes sp. NU457]
MIELVRRFEERRRQREDDRENRLRPGIATTLYAVGRGAFETNQMLNYDEQYCRSTTRLRQPVLKALIDKLAEYGIEDTRISAAEKVVIFLDYCAHKKTHREMRRMYQHSFLTFTRHIKAVSIACARLFQDSIKNKPDLRVPAQIEFSNIYSYFKGCIGAVDGSHVPVRTSKIEPGPWRNQKTWYSQNVLFACDFDIGITWVQPGYEGSAHDGTVLRRAIEKGFTLPLTHYYLGDGGYSKKHRMILVPYQKTRYHLREISDAQQRPQTKEELFNLRHARLRNCVERLNGVMKKR